MRTKVSTWGNSWAVRLPRETAQAAGLQPGTELEVTVEGEELRLAPIKKIPRYSLADMLAEMRRLGPENEPEAVDWGPDRGSEIIDDAYSRGEITLEDLIGKDDPESR